MKRNKLFIVHFVVLLAKIFLVQAKNEFGKKMLDKPEIHFRRLFQQQMTFVFTVLSCCPSISKLINSLASTFQDDMFIDLKECDHVNHIGMLIKYSRANSSFTRSLLR